MEAGGWVLSPFAPPGQPCVQPSPELSPSRASLPPAWWTRSGQVLQAWQVHRRAPPACSCLPRRVMPDSGGERHPSAASAKEEGEPSPPGRVARGARCTEAAFSALVCASNPSRRTWKGFRKELGVSQGGGKYALQ